MVGVFLALCQSGTALRVPGGSLGRRGVLALSGGSVLNSARRPASVRAAENVVARAVARPVAYFETDLPLSCGASVPAAVWVPGGASASEEAATYAYRISVGKLFRTFLGLGLPNGLARTVPLRASRGVVSAAEPLSRSALPEGTPIVVLAHGFLGSRFDLSLFGEALAAEGAVAISPDFDESLTGSYVPDGDGGTSRDAIVAACVTYARASLGATGRLGALGHSMGARQGGNLG